MKYTRMFFYLICFSFMVFILVYTAKQANLMRQMRQAQVTSTVEIVVERAYDKDMAQYGYRMIAILPEKEAKP